MLVSRLFLFLLFESLWNTIPLRIDLGYGRGQPCRRHTRHSNGNRTALLSLSLLPHLILIVFESLCRRFLDVQEIEE